MLYLFGIFVIKLPQLGFGKRKKLKVGFLTVDGKKISESLEVAYFFCQISLIHIA
jgi:hypothetical protein